MSHVFSDTRLWNNIEIVSVCGLVQTKPIQSKTRSLWSSPVQPSVCTGLDWGLPQTWSVRNGGILVPGRRLVHTSWQSQVKASRNYDVLAGRANIIWRGEIPNFQSKNMQFFFRKLHLPAGNVSFTERKIGIFKLKDRVQSWQILSHSSWKIQYYQPERSFNFQ